MEYGLSVRAGDGFSGAFGAGLGGWFMVFSPSVNRQLWVWVQARRSALAPLIQIRVLWIKTPTVRAARVDASHGAAASSA